MKKLTDDVEELKEAIEFNNSLIEVLKEDNASLRVEVNNLSAGLFYHYLLQAEYQPLKFSKNPNISEDLKALIFFITS